jgi:hypothetical protein
VRSGGGTWSCKAPPTTRFLADCVATSASDVIVVGESAYIAQWNGSGFVAHIVPAGTTAHLQGVASQTVLGTFAVGDGGTILRRSGTTTTWVGEPSGASRNLNAVAACRSFDPIPNLAMAVGQGGTILIRR